MIGQTLRKKVLITNPQGFHMRPATAFARLALQFPCDVRVVKEDQSVDGKSPISLLTLCALPGTELTIEVSGPGAREALEALVGVINVPAEEPADGTPPTPAP